MLVKHCLNGGIMRHHKKIGKGYLFICIDTIDRLVKICAVSNIINFRHMMKYRHPSYEIINDDNPYVFMWCDNTHWRIMDKLQGCKMYSSNEYRTYKLDNYKVQTVIKLLMGDKPDTGEDILMCNKCNEEYIGDYSKIQNIDVFLNLDTRYCSDECKEAELKDKEWKPQQRYCRCGQIFYPIHKTDFDCQRCKKDKALSIIK
jgi:hypothetical protein